MKKIFSPLALILIAHTLLGIGFGLATPIFEPPDEANHYLFARYLQVYHTLPVQGMDREGARAHHPPLYHLLAALISAWVPIENASEHISLPVNPHVTYRYGDPHRDNKAYYLHFSAEETWPYRGQALAVHLMRLVSVFFSTLAVWFTYLTARWLRPDDEPFALLSAGLLAFNGMVLFMSGVVQNSTSAIAATAFVLYPLTRFMREGFSFKKWVGVGLALALGILLQVSGLILAAPLGLALLYDAWRTKSWPAFGRGALGLLLPVLVVDGWWFARNWLLYGDLTANNTIAALWTYGPIEPPAVTLYLIATGVVGRFGHGLMVEFPPLVYFAAGLVALLALLGLGRLLLSAIPSRTRTPSLQPSAPRPQTLTSAFLWFLQPLTLLAVSASLVVYVRYYIHGAHGRYLFTAFPCLAFLLAAGILAWFRPRWRTPVAAAFLLVELGLALYGLFGLLIPTYAKPRSFTEAELEQVAAADANIGDTARIVGYQLEARLTHPGDDFTVTVYWQPLSQTDVPYTVFVHLYHPSVGSLAQVDTYPGGGNYATTVWDVGRPFGDTYVVSIPANAPPLENVQVVIGLYNEQTQQRLPVAGLNAGSPDQAWVQLGKISLKAAGR